VNKNGKEGMGSWEKINKFSSNSICFYFISIYFCNELVKIMSKKSNEMGDEDYFSCDKCNRERKIVFLCDTCGCCFDCCECDFVYEEYMIA
jgi:hypothetical protein